MDPREHWNRVWRPKAPEQLSWYQTVPAVSLELIAASGIARDAAIIDVGGGASLFVDHLLDRGYSKLAVLDLSAAALDASRTRLGNRATGVEWHEADVTRFEAPHRYSLWHARRAAQVQRPRRHASRRGVARRRAGRGVPVTRDPAQDPPDSLASRAVFPLLPLPE